MTAVRKGRQYRKPTLLALLTATTAAFVFAIAASTAQPAWQQLRDRGSTPATLPGANLKVDGTAPPALDWANVSEQRKADLAPARTTSRSGRARRRIRPSRPSWTAASRRTRATCSTWASTSRRKLRRAVPEHVLASRPGAERHDEHGLRVQQVKRPVGQRRHPGTHRGRRPDPVRPARRAARTRQLFAVTVGHHRRRLSV